eukprot:snap_masked-scaffold695_size110128-processed-gene-0.13 protein:Tk05648 transcript:snap_masked-scaffold695_size110128-processed-gene-0.13-mRNA-1 annotation:"putative uncharacterized protein"
MVPKQNPNCHLSDAVGDCSLDQFTLTSPGNFAPPVICGYNNGQHSKRNEFVSLTRLHCSYQTMRISVIVDASDACHEARFALTGSASRAWDIKGRIHYICLSVFLDDLPGSRGVESKDFLASGNDLLRWEKEAVDASVPQLNGVAVFDASIAIGVINGVAGGDVEDTGNASNLVKSLCTLHNAISFLVGDVQSLDNLPSCCSRHQNSVPMSNDEALVYL